jgi:hypothetical protein
MKVKITENKSLPKTFGNNGPHTGINEKQAKNKNKKSGDALHRTRISQTSCVSTGPACP